MLSSSVWRGGARYAFCVGLMLGALTTATVLLAAGSLVRLVAAPVLWRWAMLATFTALLLRELGFVRFWLPQNKRLVPEHLDRNGRFFGPLQFGFEMGTSARTYTPSALPHAAALAVALLAGLPATVAVGLGFGLGRSAMTLGNLRYSQDNTWDLAWLDHERLIKAVLVAGFAAAGVTVLLGPR
jgi:hypothetical protein